MVGFLCFVTGRLIFTCSVTWLLSILCYYLTHIFVQTLSDTPVLCNFQKVCNYNQKNIKACSVCLAELIHIFRVILFYALKFVMRSYAWGFKLTAYTLRGGSRIFVWLGAITSWWARERKPIWGSGGCAPSGVQGQSLRWRVRPPKTYAYFYWKKPRL